LPVGARRRGGPGGARGERQRGSPWLDPRVKIIAAPVFSASSTPPELARVAREGRSLASTARFVEMDTARKGDIDIRAL
jgi:hypothetical protein